MSAHFVTALAASAEAASGQHYPHGALYIVATPIGNLADISLRAMHVLALSDMIACEDTRHTQTLLRAYGIDKSPGQLLALHQHNEAEASMSVIEQLRSRGATGGCRPGTAFAHHSITGRQQRYCAVISLRRD